MLLKHGAIYLSAKIPPSILGLLSLAIYSRLLGPDEYGHFAILYSVAGITYVLFYAWLWFGLVRFIPQFQNREQLLEAVILRAFILLSLIGGLAGSILALAWQDDSTRSLVWLAIPLCWLMGWYEINLELLRARLQSAKYTIVSISKSIITVLASSTMAYLGLGAEGMVWGLMIGMLLPLAILFDQSWKKAFHISSNRKILIEISHYGLPLTISTLLVMLIFGSDRILIGLLLNPEMAGQYSMANDLALKSLHTLTIAIDLAAFPLVVHTMSNSDLKTTHSQLLKNSTLLLALILPAATGLLVLNESLINLLLDKNYRESATKIFPWIVLSTFLVGISQAHFQHAFTLGRNTTLLVKIMMVAYSVNIGLNILWIPKFGIMGAAYASVCAFSLLLLLSWFYGRRVFKLPVPWQNIARVLTASMTMAVVLLSLERSTSISGLLSQIVLGFVIYGLLIMILNPDDYRGKFFRKLLELTQQPK